MANATCSVDDCEKVPIARGWCDVHYRRWRKYGDPLAGRLGAYPDGATCQVEGCAKRPHASGYCAPHYAQWKRHGDPLVKTKHAPYGEDEACLVDGCEERPRIYGRCVRHGSNLARYGNAVPQSERPLEVRLRETGWTVTESGCWEWNGTRNDNGYGIVTMRRKGLMGARVHRLTYEHFVGPIPQDHEIRHRCDNPPCVNPDHLETGTHAQNMQDMADRGRRRIAGAATRAALGV